MDLPTKSVPPPSSLVACPDQLLHFFASSLIEPSAEAFYEVETFRGTREGWFLLSPAIVIVCARLEICEEIMVGNGEVVASIANVVSTPF